MVLSETFGRTPIENLFTWARTAMQRVFWLRLHQDRMQRSIQGKSTSHQTGCRAIRKQILLPEVCCNRTCRLSVSCSEGSEGTHLVLMYDDARPRPYLVEGLYQQLSLVKVWQGNRILLSFKDRSLTLYCFFSWTLITSKHSCTLHTPIIFLVCFPKFIVKKAGDCRVSEILENSRNKGKLPLALWLLI